MPTIAKLVVQLNLNDSQYQKGVTAAINQAKRAEQNISSSTNKLQQTAQTKFNAVGNGFSGLAGKLENIGSTISDSFHKVGRGLAIGLAAGITAVTAAVIVGGKRVLELGADANETASLLETSLGPATEYLNNELKEFASNANRSFFELQAGSSTFVAMTKSMGATQDQAANLGVSFTKAATDLGSFFNVPTEQALQDIQSALAGSSETLTKYGIDIRETTLKQMALDQGLISSANEVLPQLVRAQLIEQAILEQGSDAMGDAIRTSDSWQNSMRGLKGRIRDFATEAGKRLIPVLSPILSIVGDLAEQAIPFLSDALDTVTPIVQFISETARKLFDNIQMGMRPLDAFSIAIESLVGNEAAQWFRNTVTSVQEFIATVQRVLQPVFDTIASIVQWQDVAIAFAIAIGAVVIPIIWSILSPILVVIATIAAAIAVIAVLRAAWENDWGGIRTVLTAAWEGTIKPALTAIGEWITGTVIPAVQMLWNTWVNVVWPAISAKLQEAWAFIQPILVAIGTWITGTLIPTIESLWNTWVNVVWPAIQTITENVWTVISAIFEEIGRWINDNIIPWIEHFKEVWADTVWPAIKEAVRLMWDFVEPVFQAIQEWAKDNLPPVMNGLKGIFESVMSGIKAAVQPVKDLWDALVSAVQGFFDWISSHTFEFKIELPDLPDWATPGSPIPLHTAWENYGRFLDRTDFDVSMNLNGADSMAAGMVDRTALATAGNSQVNQPFNMYGNVTNGMTERELETKVRRWIRDENRKR